MEIRDRRLVYYRYCCAREFATRRSCNGVLPTKFDYLHRTYILLPIGATTTTSSIRALGRDVYFTARIIAVGCVCNCLNALVAPTRTGIAQQFIVAAINISSSFFFMLLSSCLTTEPLRLPACECVVMRGQNSNNGFLDGFSWKGGSGSLSIPPDFFFRVNST